METIKLSVTELEMILEKAKKAKEMNSSLSNTISIGIVKEADDTHLGTDKVRAELLCNYSECIGETLYSYGSII